MLITNAIVQDMPEAIYHANQSLSSTGARRLLESPAKFDYWRTHQQPGKQAYDLGTAAHTKILGVGSGVIAYPDEHITASGSVSTKAATVAWAEEQRANGLTPIAPAQARRVDGMAEAVLSHETAGPRLEQSGSAEASVFATDKTSAVEMRARFDFLPDLPGNSPVAVDLKTSSKPASVDGFTRSVAAYGYDVQEQWYLHALEQAGHERIPFVFVVVETEAPHLVGAHQLDIEWQLMGAAKVRRALDTYARCLDTGIWPGYDPAIQLISPPAWSVYQFEDDYEPLPTAIVM
jgi:hypothetical protein